ncbi:polysaccharide deacetylase family protein [Ectobacillus ponti]|uniref:Polysaccharide deacetylase n=1 Tax=Ectobacillus ponti TaxID=2961894 RepID=A0AA41X968_9BACI|nr:polysaccharide deacetylase family protein [Ectobacillus ponti]MCP8967681.1 polysaccharide deacetylase [Ectobacillus ponti]
MANKSLLSLVLCAGLLFCASPFTSSAKAQHAGFVSPVHTHHLRSLFLADKKLSDRQFRFVRESMQVQHHYARKVAYLTFDDGPNQYTPQLLRILKEKGVQGTFFVIGGRVAQHPDVARRILRDGHYIGLHSMSHNAERLYHSSPGLLVGEMEEARRIVEDETGVHTLLVRVPYGSRPFLKQAYRDALAASQFKMWDWTIDTNDWSRGETAASMLKTVERDSNDDTEVILMHDSRLAVQALPRMIDILMDKGYTMLPYSPNYHIAVNFWDDARL